jgi:hypothetical protein
VSQTRRVLEPLRRAWREKLQRAVLEVVSGEVNRAVDQVVSTIRDVEWRSRRDLFAAGEREAAAESSRLINTTMRSAKMLPNPLATLEYALSLAPAEGMALEFGVFAGTTLRVIARERGGRDVYGFDSFEGLPEDWRAGFQEGFFGGDMLPSGPPSVPGARLVTGWFHETLPDFLAEHPEPVAFLHIDADLYSSARTVLELVGPRLRAGSVIVFDEFFNYPGWRDGEYRAWTEYLRTSGWSYRYEAFTVDNEQVVVRLTSGDTESSVDNRADERLLVKGDLNGNIDEESTEYSLPPGQPVS